MQLYYLPLYGRGGVFHNLERVVKNEIDREGSKRFDLYTDILHLC
jgi:hypothetical protein